RPVLRATIEPAGEGSRIRGRYTLMRLVVLFMALWFGLLGMTGADIGVEVVAGGWGSTVLWILAVVAGMAVFGAMLVVGGMYISRSDTEEIDSRLRGFLDEES
ncbi:MAG: hypothetical protein ABEN55_13855, partial [Bradymonadaceae bacterium]